MQGLVQQWNESLESCREEVRRWNSEVASRLEANAITPQAALEALMAEPRMVPAPNEKWARWFLVQWGWSILSKSSDSQQWLPYSHPDMVSARTAFRDLIDTHGCHPGLILNYDQLWRSAWMTSGKLLWKSGEKGLRVSRAKAPQRADKKIHSVKHGRRGITVSWKHFTCKQLFLTWKPTVMNMT